MRQTLPKPKRSGSLFSYLLSLSLLSPSQFHLELLTDRQHDSNVHGIVDGQNLLYIRYVRYFTYVEFFLTHGLRSTICTYMYDMYICTRLSSRETLLTLAPHHAHTTLAPHHARTTPHAHTTLVHHLLHTVSPSGEHNNQPDDDDGDG